MSIRQWLTALLLPVSALHCAGAGLAGAALLPFVAAGSAEAKTPGATYCYHGTCHRVKTVLETESLIGREELLNTSFYDDCSRDRYNPCGLTSSGEVFRPYDADNAASPIYPDGTTLLVRNPANQETAVVRVNNAGPYWGKRKLDVSRGVAEKLGFRKSGVAALEVRVVKAPKPSEARYRRHRVYDAVPGYIGRFASADTATAGLTAFMALENLASAFVQPVAVLAALAEGTDSGVAASGETQIAAAIKKRVGTRVAKSSRAKKATRLASSRKGLGKRRIASSRKLHGRGHYASYGSKRAKGKYAYKARGKSRKLAWAKRGSRSQRGYAAYRGAGVEKAVWSKRGGKSRTAGRGAKRLARL